MSLLARKDDLIPDKSSRTPWWRWRRGHIPLLSCSRWRAEAVRIWLRSGETLGIPLGPIGRSIRSRWTGLGGRGKHHLTIGLDRSGIDTGRRGIGEEAGDVVAGNDLDEIACVDGADFDKGRLERDDVGELQG